MAEIIDNVSHVDWRELKQILSNPSSPILVVDVRELEEYEAAHIPGIPLVPMSEIVDVVDRFDKDREYVLVCRSGRRSLEVAKFFQANGIERVHNFKGGMLSWIEEGNETAQGPEHVVKDYTPEHLERK